MYHSKPCRRFEYKTVIEKLKIYFQVKPLLAYNTNEVTIVWCEKTKTKTTSYYLIGTGFF